MRWSSLMEMQWRKFKDDFSNYLKYYIFECEAMVELAKNTQRAEEEYLARENELALKKHRLFQDKNFEHWQLREEDRRTFENSALIYNKRLSFPKMLPDVGPTFTCRRQQWWTNSFRSTGTTSTEAKTK